MSSEIPKSPENKQNPSAPQAIDNARMQMILSLNPAVIYACRPDGDYGATDISDNIKEQLGYEPADFIDNSEFWASRLHPEDAPQVFEDLPKVFQTGRYSLEYRFRHKNGEYRWMRDELRLVTGAGGKPVEIIGSWTDITERKQLEEQRQCDVEELHHFQELMHYVISHAASAIAIHDRDLNYIYVSDRYLKDFRVEGQNVIGKHHYEVFPDLPQKWRDVHQRCLKGEILSAEEDPYVRADGTVDWTRWECRPWYESDN